MTGTAPTFASPSNLFPPASLPPNVPGGPGQTQTVFPHSTQTQVASAAQGGVGPTAVEPGSGGSGVSSDTSATSVSPASPSTPTGGSDRISLNLSAMRIVMFLTFTLANMRL